MALPEKHRNTIYNALVPLLGEEATQAMLSEYPARDLDEPITRDHLRAELAQLRVEMHQAMNRQLVVILTAMAIAVAVILGGG